MVKNIVICDWFGRFGNNLITLINALHLALSKDLNNIYFAKHPFFVGNKIKLKDGTETENVFPQYGKYFYYPHNVEKQFGKFVDEKHRSIVLEHLKQVFKMKTINAFDDNTVTVHIRSGDLFKRERPHSKYIVPPNDYYKKILDKLQPKKIVIVAEDDINPSVNYLLKEYSSIATYIPQSLEKDIQIILNSKIVIGSFGTFVPAICTFSSCIKKIYMPAYKKCYPEIEYVEPIITNIDCDNYFSEIGKWAHTQSQIQMINTYTIPALQ